MIEQLNRKPELFEPGEPLFWNDPHISRMMLETHLNPETDAASRRPATIDAHVDWLVDYLKPEPGASWLDLGCGPGLYTIRLAQRGLTVSGVDYSERSIAYAREYAAEHNLSIDYRYQNYLTLEDEGLYDVVSLIFGDFCVPSPADRMRLLANVHRALKPGGYFVLDVTTPPHRARYGAKTTWYAVTDSGFWKPGPHLVLEQGFAYPDDVYLDQYAVIEDDHTLTIYRNWFQDYTPERIRAELTANRFDVLAMWGDLGGTPYTDKSEWIGLVTQRVE